MEDDNSLDPNHDLRPAVQHWLRGSRVRAVRWMHQHTHFLSCGLCGWRSWDWDNTELLCKFLLKHMMMIDDGFLLEWCYCWNNKRRKHVLQSERRSWKDAENDVCRDGPSGASDGSLLVFWEEPKIRKLEKGSATEILWMFLIVFMGPYISSEFPLRHVWIRKHEQTRSNLKPPVCYKKLDAFRRGEKTLPEAMEKIGPKLWVES